LLERAAKGFGSDFGKRNPFSREGHQRTDK
jgi:hypothetical protein